MAKNLTFFSYSRSDSEFVLRLAKDLRDSGAEVWLDQLDIRAGSHWDASIEAALTAASQLLVVLTPASVASNNVMDEVSFALETGKSVIPVLLKDCTPPFRLRRLQRIDFTGDYQTALVKLLGVLGNSGTDTSQEKQPLKPAPVIEDAAPPVSPKAPEVEKRETPENKIREKAKTPERKEQQEAKKKIEAIAAVPAAPQGNHAKAYLLVGATLLIAVLGIWWATRKSGSDSPTSGEVVTTQPGDTNGLLKQLGDKPQNQATTNAATDSPSHEGKGIKAANWPSKLIKPVNDPATISHASGTKHLKPQLTVGRSYQGGIIFYIDESGEHGLIASTLQSETPVSWVSAAKWCIVLEENGYKDWCLPTKSELNLLMKSGIGGMKGYYWSSSAADNNLERAWAEAPGGKVSPVLKTFISGVRAVRTF